MWATQKDLEMYKKQQDQIDDTQEKKNTTKNSVFPMLQKIGISVFGVPVDSSGHFVWDELWNVLTTPSSNFHGITSILVEGGTRTWEGFRSAGFLDEEVLLVGNSQQLGDFKRVRK